MRSVAHALERLGLALLVGGSLFVFATGVLNIQLWYPFGFSFVPAHYYGAIVFVAALAFHVVLKLTVVRRAFGRARRVAPAARRPRAHPARAAAGRTEDHRAGSARGADDDPPCARRQRRRGLARGWR